MYDLKDKAIFLYRGDSFQSLMWLAGILDGYSIITTFVAENILITEPIDSSEEDLIKLVELSENIKLEKYNLTL